MIAIARMRNALTRRRPRPAEETVRFHAGPQGQPVPCFDAHCSTPHLTPEGG